MKENKENIYRKIYNYLEKKYQAPEECKLIMAERNLTTMFKAQIMLIILGFFGLISLLILNKGHYLESIPRFIYFGEYVVFGLRSHNRLSAKHHIQQVHDPFLQ